jgi:hypothetical protein
MWDNDTLYTPTDAERLNVVLGIAKVYPVQAKILYKLGLYIILTNKYKRNLSVRDLYYVFRG